MLFLPPPVILPGFHRATSIDLSGLDLFLSAANPPASRCMFPELEVLSLSGCLVDAAALLLHCPRLRVLRATGCSLGHAIRSASLQVLLLENKHKSTSRVHIDVPGLKQLNLSIHTRGELRLSISAPMVEKALWRCCYSKAAAGIGPWGLAMVSFETAESNNALCLWMESDDSSLGSFSFPQTGLSLAQEIEKHLVVTTFNVLDLHFNTTGHAFGAFVFHLLRIHWILTATKSLKIELGKKGKTCPINCPCDEPGNWRSETILLINLEEVEIRAFGGEDYDFDFLRLILKCAPRLKRMTVRPSDDVNDDLCTKVYDILKVYPSVECNVFPN
uniref:FBD domain-containing protein n=1 Tax=Hordeum vulgare subsp. vulgare TaxID=112509 RepID=A0A8I6YIJ4_HORVV